MLGLLGTFVGMVDTLQGAVVALQGTTELEAIRDGLAAPIKGLGLAFGTSVAGVAASAMLGLMSTLSRRERIFATRQLDAQISSVFKDFSLTHNRQETYKALQGQAKALPAVADQLESMAEKLALMGERLAEQLNSKQDNFHVSVKHSYEALAQSVAVSLKESLAENGRIAGVSIQPIIEASMAGISQTVNESAKETHQQLSDIVESQLDMLTGQFKQTSTEVTQAWKTGVSEHEQSNKTLIEGMGQKLSAFTVQFEQLSTGMLESIKQNSDETGERQTTRDDERLKLWADTFEQAQQQGVAIQSAASESLTEEFKRVTETQHIALKEATQDFASMSSKLTAQWREAGTQTLLEQQRITETLDSTAKTINRSTTESSDKLLNDMAKLLSSSESLVDARIAAEATWLESHGERMQELTRSMGSELSHLRGEEQQRAEAFVEQLSKLEESSAKQLAALGQSIEEPMLRLIETASETPKAAAEVISKLREEISNNIERDNSLLEERARIMRELDTVSESLSKSSSHQREAVEQLVQSSTGMLENISKQFDNHVGAEVSKLSDIAENFSGSAIEMASLGDAFGLAVQLFNGSNDKLIDNLKRIESALDDSSARSDEQLGYYVAQAREIIDHSVMSQKALFEELRQLSSQSAADSD